MYKQILVPVDESETAHKALREAAMLAAQWQAKLRIVHVIDPFLINRDSTFLDIDMVRRGLHESGNKLLDEAREQAEQVGAAADTKLIELDKPTSSIAEMIVAEAHDWPAGLIVVGSHGRRGVQRLFLGSVAENLARISAVPVLLVRGQ